MHSRVFSYLFASIVMHPFLPLALVCFCPQL